MQFSVKKRDGPAKLGELLIGNKKVVTPNILFINTPRFKPPDFADLVVTNKNIKTEKPTLKIMESIFSPLNCESNDEIQLSRYMTYQKDLPDELHLAAMKLYKKRKEHCNIIYGNKEIINDLLKNNSASFFIVGNTVQLFHQQSEFVDFITELREKIGNQRIIYLPCVGDPTNLALLTYIGIDLFDSVSAILAARTRNLLFSTGKYNVNNLEEATCSCPACSKFKSKPYEMNFQQILSHNYFALLDEIRKVRNAIFIGNLRELVEIRVRTDPSLTALLRFLDQDHYNFVEERTAIIRKNRLIATTKDALHRVEIKRFQERIINRYKKPESTKILLLIPCSAKKPYSFSKSHQKFKKILYNLRNPQIIHEVIITSPLGIVPRELELTYPASAYDIPVTGCWDEDEKKMIRELLRRFIEFNRYEKVILHLPRVVRKIIEGIVKEPVDTEIESSPTSYESLERLSDVLKKTTESYEKIKPSIRKKEDMKSLASYQFGEEIANELLKDCIIKGKYPYQKIIQNNTQIGMITKERGLISLTIDGAKILAKYGKYWVKIHDDFTLKGSVFAPGIIDADKSIRISDEVSVLKNNKLCAVGVAQMNGSEMRESTHGEAVKIRHIA